MDTKTLGKLVSGGFVLTIGVTWIWKWVQRSESNKHDFVQERRKKILDSFSLSISDLREIMGKLTSEMEKGLVDTHSSTVKMLPSFVSVPSGNEKGSFYALDLGGTNFRVIQLDLKGNGKFGESKKEKYTIPENAMQGSAEELFGFVASCVEDFMKKYANLQEEVSLGFTFSFPIDQTKINSGTLIHWTKGFSSSGVEGKDVVELLQNEFKKKNLNIRISAILNDTVGTMMTRAYEDNRCEMGVILGTGTNACYSEKIENIKKLKIDTDAKEMIINMEWGGFGSNNTNLLPVTKYDKQIDVSSLNPGAQIFEKMISGFYLGDIAKGVIIDMVDQKLLFVGDPPIKQLIKFPTELMAEIASDTCPNLSNVKKRIEQNFEINSTLEDRKVLQEICNAVATRAARLSAMAIVTVLNKIGKTQHCSVAVDGTVYEKYPQFKEKIQETIQELAPGSSINLYLSQDGSGIGAAVVASIA